MIKIAHRGNFEGGNTPTENTIAQIDLAIAEGYDVKIDVWLLNDKWYLGYNLPQEEIDLAFMERPTIWTHCRDLKGYVSLYHNPKVNALWHSSDDFTFTSKGIKWAASGIRTTDGIMTFPHYEADLEDEINFGIIQPLGVCSDTFYWLRQSS